VFHSSAKLRTLSLAATLAAVLAGCHRPASAPDAQPHTREFTDALNRRIAVSYPPQRIISLAPNLTEMLFALGLDAQIVGVTSYCDYPPPAQSKVKVGDTLQPDLERLIALSPDLVLVSTSSQLESLARRLGELSIPVYVTDPRTVREVASSLLALGELTDSTATANTLAAEMERRIKAVEARVGGLARPRVLYALQTEPLITIGRRTFLNDLISLAGGESVSASETADYPQFSRETVIARAPEVIVAQRLHGNSAVSEESLRRIFAETPAARSGRIALVDPDLVNRPGPRITDGLEEMARALHPESNIEQRRQ
jgi:iron complex transport system substrate-binding protein